MKVLHTWRASPKRMTPNRGVIHSEHRYTRVYKTESSLFEGSVFKPDERTWCVVLTDFGLHRSYASINSRITDVFKEPTMPIKKGFMNQIFNQSHFKGTKEIKTNKPVPEQYRNTLSVRTVTSYGLEDWRNRTAISSGSNGRLSIPKRPDRL